MSNDVLFNRNHKPIHNEFVDDISSEDEENYWKNLIDGMPDFGGADSP